MSSEVEQRRGERKAGGNSGWEGRKQNNGWWIRRWRQCKQSLATRSRGGRGGSRQGRFDARISRMRLPMHNLDGERHGRALVGNAVMM